MMYRTELNLNKYNEMNGIHATMQKSGSFTIMVAVALVHSESNYHLLWSRSRRRRRHRMDICAFILHEFPFELFVGSCSSITPPTPLWYSYIHSDIESTYYRLPAPLLFSAMPSLYLLPAITQVYQLKSTNPCQLNSRKVCLFVCWN